MEWTRSHSIYYPCLLKNAMTLLVGQQEEHPIGKNSVIRYCHDCLERGANDLHMVKPMLLSPHRLVRHYNPECLIYLYGAILLSLSRKRSH